MNYRKEIWKISVFINLTSGVAQFAIRLEIEHVVHGAYNDPGQSGFRNETKRGCQQAGCEQHETA